MDNEMIALTQSLAKIVEAQYIAVKITMSKEFYEELRKLIPFTVNTGSDVNILHGIPFEVIDDPLAPGYSIEYEYRPLSLLNQVVGEKADSQ